MKAKINKKAIPSFRSPQNGLASAFVELRRNYAVFMALAFLWVIWGYNFLVIKITLLYVGPFLFALLRTSLSFAVLILGLALSGHLRFPTRHQGLLLVLGFLQTGGFTGLTYLALVNGGTGKTALLAFTNPLWATLCAWYFLSDRPRLEQIGTVVLAITGVLLVVQFWTGGTSWISGMYALLAGVSLGASSIVVKKLQERGENDLFHITAWQMLFGSLPLLLLAIVIPEKPLLLTGTFVFGLTYNIFSTALGWPLWVYILKKLPAGTANMNTLVIPMVGILSGYLHLQERLSALDVVGIACISCSLLLLWLRPARPA